MKNFLDIVNPIDILIENICLDFSDFQDIFIIEEQVNVTKLRKGDSMRKWISIEAKEDYGIFTRIIQMKAGDVTFSREITIKVGGSEIAFPD